MTGTTSDIEKDRADGERLYRGLFEQTSFGMARVGLDGRWLEVNDRLCAIVGYDRDELLASTFQEITHPDDLGADLDQARRLLAGEENSYGMDKRYVRKDGSIAWVQLTVSLVRDEAGNPESFLSIIKDIGERKRAEEAALRGEQWRRLVIDNVRDFAIFSTDTEGRVATWNAGAERHYGFREGEILGRHFEVIFTPEDRAAGVPARELDEAAATGRAGDNRWHLRKDGSRFLVTGSVAPIRDASGAIVGFTKATQDITERTRLESALQAAKQEAEDASRAKDEFLAMLSHELRTPLNPILLAVSAMIERPPEPPDLRPTLEMIRDNVGLQARIIDDLLDVMRIVRGKMPLRWGACDAHDLLRRAVEICRAEVLDKDHRVDLDLAARAHGVNADPARLQQVFWNLLKNAAKFTPRGGTIAVRTRDEGDEILIEVVDSGIGIEPAILPHVFDAFHQGDPETTRRFGGLGLGLAICRGIVEAHGGRISAESPGPGRGATFRIALKTTALPKGLPAREAWRTPGASPAPAPAQGRLRILLVDDEPDTLKLTAILLRNLGHAVSTARTLADAWEAFRRADGLDLIISDIGLPDGTGFDLMRRVKQVRTIPAIALTGYGMDEDIRRSREAGFTTHLVKPVEFPTLEAIIRQIAP